MTGTLGLFSLVDLFQLLAAASRTGRLAVDHPQGNARVYFDKGQVVHAEFAQLVGEEAVYALFADEQGSFEFTVGLPAPKITVKVGTENLVLEAIRRLDEARREDDEVALNAVPVFPRNAPNAGSLTLQAQEVLVLRLVDGQRSVGRIAEEAAIDPQEVKTVIGRLVKIGALQLKARKPRTARLVTRLAEDHLPGGAVGVDVNILNNWERVIGFAPNRVACRRPDGRVDIFKVCRVEGAGPFILFSRDNLFRADLAANVALLVRPVPRQE